MGLLDKFWVEEFEDLDLFDERINRRVISLLCTMSANPCSSISGTFKDAKQAKAAYRLLDNDSVDIEEILALHYEKTALRCHQFNRVILIQDSTGFSYRHKSKTGMGRIGKNNPLATTEASGLLCHNMLAFSEAGEPLGLFDQHIWARGKCADKSTLHSLPIHKKESYRWIRPLKKEDFAEASKTQFIIISDRESDFRIYMGEVRRHGFDFIIRMTSDRVEALHKQSLESVFEAILDQTIVELPIKNRTLSTEFRRSPKIIRNKKTEQLTAFSMKYCSVQLAHATEEKTPFIESVNLVEIKELNPKNGRPISWIIATTLPVNNKKEAQEILDLYRSRWRIEVYHKSQKSSCGVEKTGLRKADRIKRLITFKSLIAFAICRIKYLLDSCPEEPAEKYFEKDLIKAMNNISLKKTPLAKYKVKDFIFNLANLEGYKTYNLKTPPGVIIIGKAIFRFNMILYGYSLALKRKDVGKC